MIAAVVVVLSGGGVARAHGGRPQTQAILFDGDDGSGRVVVVATFGLLVGDDGGASFGWTCQESIPDGIPGIAYPALLAGGDRLLIATPYGLVRGDGAGCAWGREEMLIDRYVADVARAPDRRVIALGGDSAVANRIFASADEGASFEAIGAALPEGLLPERLRIAPSDAQRMYVTGERFTAGTTDVSGVVMTTRDGGASWIEHALPRLESVNGERVVRALAVDPTDPDVLYVVVQGSEHDRLLRSSDAGASFELVMRLEALPMPFYRPFALALAPDGSAYFGNTAEGLWVRRADGTVALVDKYVALACLVLRGTEMWMCGDGLEDGFALARFATDARYEKEVVLTFGAIARRTCGTRVDCTCDPWWNDFLSEVGRTAELADAGPGCPPEPDDGGAPARDAGGSLDGGAWRFDGGASPRPSGGGCGCRVGRRSGAPLPALFALALLALATRRRGLGA